MRRLPILFMALILVAPLSYSPMSSEVAAQGPGVLKKIGITLKKLRGATVNRKGNNPGRERPAPLKPINDPSFFEEGVPEILAKAAEVKKAEDLAKQKIKAVKYLASIGCSCYDIDDSITEALIGASDDCTEDVRLATVKAIMQAASAKSCKNCGDKSCCKKDMVMRLAKMAYERKDNGCYEEPSKRVREMAKKALHACCSNTEPITEIEPKTPEVIHPETSTDENKAREVNPSGDDANADVDTPADGDATDGDETGDEKTDEKNADDATGVDVNFVPPLDFGGGGSQVPAGVVMQVNERLRIAHVHFEDGNLHVRPGSKLMAVVVKEGRRHWLGPLTVYEGFKGSASVNIQDADLVQLIKRGTPVIGTMRLASRPPEPKPLTHRTTDAKQLSTGMAPVVPAQPPVHRRR